MKLEIITTADGSHTIYLPELNEHYHSVHGAIAESRHIFINAGFYARKSNHVNIFEVGFGTGLNALLTCLESKATQCTVTYCALEPFPLDEKIWKLLNYPQMLGNSEASNWIMKLHNASWNTQIRISEQFIFMKQKSGLAEAKIPYRAFDLIYFDAFAPTVQPELWSQEVFEKLFRACVAGARIVTYCAKGEVRRKLQRAGFRVERLPGPLGKREILRGWVDKI